MLLANKEEFSATVLYRKKNYTGNIQEFFFPAHLTYACSHRIITRKKFLFSSSSKMVQGKKIQGNRFGGRTAYADKDLPILIKRCLTRQQRGRY